MSTYKKILLTFLILFSIIGYVPYNHVYAGSAINSWTTTVNLTTATTNAASVATNGYLYNIGGGTGSSPVTTVAYAKLDPNGSVSSWSTTTALGTARYQEEVVAYAGYIYVLGGYTGSAGTTSVVYGQVNSDGTISSWSTGTALPATLYRFGAVAVNGYIYIYGGYNGSSYQNASYSISLNGDGSMAGSWTSQTTMSDTIGAFSTVTSNNYIYVLGGSTGAVSTHTEYVQITSPGTLGSWATTTALSAGEYYTTAAIYGNYIYIVGGFDGTNHTANAYTATISSTGTIGSWSSTTAYSQQFSNAGYAQLGQYFYVIGGENSSAAAVKLVSFGLLQVLQEPDSTSNTAVGTGGDAGSSSTNFSENETIGQSFQNTMTSTHFTLKTGFQYYDYGFSGASMSLSLSTGTLAFGSVTLNSLATANHTVTVQTNAIHGYTLYIKENHDLQNNSNAALTIAPFTGGSTSAASVWTSSATNGFGYNASGVDAASDFLDSTYYRQLDSSNTHSIASTNFPTQTTGGDVTTITYQIDPPSSASAGTYVNTVTYTVVGSY